MINQNFCTFLEFEICKAFRNAERLDIKGFWCDGVILPLIEDHYSKKNVNDNRQIIMTAYIGKDGQDKYELVLKFGNKSLSKYSRDLDIRDCIPSFDNLNGFDIDIKNKIIELQLD